MAKNAEKKEVVEVKETKNLAPTVAEAAAVAATEAVVTNVLTTGKINYKKVALVAGGTVAVVSLGYLAKKFYDKKKAEKEVSEDIPTCDSEYAAKNCK